ncbi:halo transducer protein [Halorubrum amylolyticum]|uniref:halo transducer protein n=1 Tax=Halorubrum amylolyticum TaxID=2508724 RepID=UPI0010087A30|nr:halo transducer protein [Halorubrum amylolyticum]
MNGGGAGDGPEDLDGLSVDAAVDAVDDGESDADEVRETLAIVAQDGTVRRAAVDDALANASKVVTTAETRVELAAEQLTDARETAAPVSDLDLVSVRSGEFAARLDAIEDRASELGDDLQAILAEKDDGDLYEIARRIRRVTNAARGVQRAADDLQFELDSFETWLADADRRAAAIGDDVEAVAESLRELDDVAEELSGGSGDAESGPADGWATAMVRHRVTGLMLADLRAELTALRRWADRDGADPPADVESRLDDLAARHESVGERLTERADPAWTDRFGDRLEALDGALDEMEPPVAWSDVEAVIEDHRPTVE